MIPSLPDDVMIHVMLQADYRTILTLRRASSSLNLLTRTHEVWASLLAESEGANPDQKPRIFYLERAFSTYTASELEKLYIERVKDKTPWITKGLANLKDSLAFPWPSGHRDCMILVPGGRWLLVPEDPKGPTTVSNAFTHEMRAERMWCYDLNNSDTPELVPRALFGDQSYDLSTMSLSGPQIDTSASTLTFNFAQVYREQTGEDVDFGKSPWILHIWRVSLKHNSRLKHDNLSAQCLKTIDLGELEGPGKFRLFHGSLLEDHISLSVTISDTISVVMVVNWADAVDGAHQFRATPLPRVMEHNQLDALQLLPHSKILFIATAGFVTSVQYDCEQLTTITDLTVENALANMNEQTGVALNERFLGTLPGIDPNSWERKKSYAPLQFLRYAGKGVARLTYITDNYRLYTAQIDYTSTALFNDENEVTDAAVTMGLEPMDLSHRASARDSSGVRHIVAEADYDSIALSPEYGVVIRGRMMHLVWNMTTLHGPRANRLSVSDLPLAEVLVVDRASGRFIMREDGKLSVVSPEHVPKESA